MRNAIIRMKGRLTKLTGMDFASFLKRSNRKRTEEESKLVAGIRLINNLKNAFGSTQTNLLYLKDATTSGTKIPDITWTKFHIDMLKQKKPSLIKRYKAHSAKYAPQIMTLDVLELIE